MTDLREIAAVGAGSVQPGAVLRQAREARRLTQEDVAQALKLAPKQVAAIESEQFDLLPGVTFARGFVRNYARMLGIDPAPLVLALDERFASAEVELNPPSNAEGIMPAGGGRRVPRLLLLMLVVVLAALAVGVYVDRFSGALPPWSFGEPAADKPAPSAASVPQGERIELPPPAPAAAQPAQAVPPPVATPEQPQATTSSPERAAPAAAPVAPPQPGMKRLEFRVGAQESWIEVRDASGKVIASQLNRPESVFTVEGRAPFGLVIGNAATVQLHYDGRPFDLAPHIAVSVARLRLE